MNTRSARRIRWALLLAVFLLGISALAAFADLNLTPPGSIKQYSWDPSMSGAAPYWTTGLNPGYWEGETAAMAAEIVGEAGNTYDLPICLQVYEDPLPTKAYAFTGFAAFNTTTRAPNLPPPTLPGGETINVGDGNWDMADIVYGYKITINSVTLQAMGAPHCNTNEVGVVVNYTPKVDSGAYLVWGGHIAKAGDALPSGAPNSTVPAGMSARYTLGNFQARLRTLAADKTLPFKVDFGPNAVSLASFGAASSATPWGVLLVGMVSLAGLIGLVATRRIR